MRSPLNQSQLGVYYACVSGAEKETNYQNPVLFPLPENVDTTRLEQAVREALGAHPYLASRIESDEQGEVFVNTPEAGESGEAFLVERFEIPETEWVAAQQSFAQPMDIYGERLYRAEIYSVKSDTSKAATYLYLDFHHVLADGFTISLILKEIERAYSGKQPSGEILSGADVAAAEESLRADEAMWKEAKEWYAHEFADGADMESLPLAQSELKTSGERSEQSVYLNCPLGVTKEDMHAMVKRFGVTEHMITEAAFGLLLANYTAEEAASFCTVFWGRNDRKMLMTASMMVHTLPVFLKANGERRVEEMLAELNEQTEQTRKYQYYAYQDAVNDLGLNNQVLFAFQGAVLADKRGLHLDGESVPYIDLRQPSPGWKMSAEFFEHEDAYSLKIGYSPADYSEAFIEQIAKTYSAILTSMTKAEYVRDIDFVDQEQTEWLNSLNPTIQEEHLPTLIERFKQHVAERPNDIFVVAGNKRLTFAEVDKLTDTIDPSYTVRCGERVVGFSVPRDERMVLAPLAIVKAGYTQLPLDSSYPEDRLQFMREDASKYTGTDALVLLYTSGTTGLPKGVMLSEKSFCSFIQFDIHHMGLNAHSRYATYAGYGFDAYQHDLWACVWAGATIHVIQDDIRFDLEGINQYLINEGITHLFMTTQMATQMVLNYPDIPGLEWLGTGGEKLMSINPPRYKLLNAYGPTETTVYVCSHYVDKNEPNIPIGKPNSDVELFIINKHGKQVPWGAAGELIVAGPQVGLGYLNQPEKTAAVYAEWNGKRVYHTGDIVRYREDGNIEFVGRKDGQVKIRGFRIELKEVEGVIREYPGIKDATVQAFDYPEGGKFIAAYIVSDQTIDIQALNNHILDQKPPYMVPAVTMQIDAIPLNQNQKVNKRALPAPEVKSQDAREESAAPLNVLEEQLKTIIVEIVKNQDFGITTDLRFVGLSSILAIKLATQIYKRYGVQLDAKMLLKGASIQTIENEILSAMLNKETSQPDSPSQPSELSEAPLSYSQTGVYFECMKNPTSTLYNVPLCIQMPLQVETEALRKAVRTAALNHSELFVHFDIKDAEVVQTIDRAKMTEENIEVAELPMSEEQLAAYKHDFIQPFNLSKDILFRFTIVRTEKNVYLMSDIHHLVCDGASYDLFIREICDILEGRAIDPEMCTYPQFVAEQKAAESGEAFAAARDFFAERLSGVENVTEISPDLINPLPQGENGRVCVPFDMAAAERYANAQGVTPAAVMLGAVYYALARFAGTDEVCITTISNGRSNLKVNNTMGMFVNTLALTSKIGSQNVADFIRETADAFSQTLAHEDYPFARIASDYDLKAEIMFAYQMGVLSDYSVFGQPVYADETMEQNVPKFKIAFYIMPINGVPSIAIEYDNGWYSEALITHLGQSVANAVQAFAAHSELPLRSISLINDEQARELDRFNETKVDYDNTQTIVSLFTAQAKATPDNTALIFQDKRFTYREVDEISDAVAAMIQSKVERQESREAVVSILINRSEWMVLASLGALKAGCAYQPLDPSYPAERLNFMMQDAKAALLIADEELRDIVNEYEGEVLLMKDLAAHRPASSGCKPNDAVKPDDLFILLYTSGSTGTPKGCQLTHGNLVAFCHWYHRYYNLQQTDKVAAYASYGFDACMMDMYPALTCGAAVCIIPEDLRLNLPDLNTYFNEEGITHSFMTTQVGCQFAMNCDNHSLKHLSVGGEKVLPITPPTSYTFHNGYGPTECTIFTTTYPMREFEQNTPIGKPLDNLQLFIVDKDMHRLPVGAMGELLVSGPQVSRGYLNLPEKTAETYIEWNGIRCYRTGDVVRYLADGNIQFVGRRDGQVKIRGFRIELKEVEAVIREFEGIKDATVQAFDYPNGGKYIAAYIVSDQPVDVQALHAFIKDRKPPYMVPAATMQIDAIPLNQNQKVNRKALPVPQLQAESRDYVEPANELEKFFCGIFASVLSLDKVGATDNFFEMGGTSLMVTRVVIEADKAGHHVAYGEIFNHPTPRLLAQFVGGESVAEETRDMEVEDFDYSGINAILQHNTIDMFLKGEKQELGHVLLTGATGYLGIHVLRELIDSDAETITCLVRGKDQHDAERRLRNLLFYYFNRRFDELFGVRLFVVNGDVTSDLAEPLSTLDIHHTTLFNCAANVKHFSKTDDIEQVNKGGAERCVEYCLKTGARLVHISTTSVGEIWIDRGDGIAVPQLDERKLYFGQFLDNRYVHSKFLAERVILDAVAHHGLNAKVMRVGNLAARSYDGEFQANFQSNSYMGRIKVFAMLGCCPYEEYDSITEFSPIDQTAKAVVLLASTPKECTVFQPFNNHTELLGDILQILEKVGRPIRFVEPTEFQQSIVIQSQDPEKAKMMSALLAYQDMTHGQKAQMIERDNRYTCAVLHRLGFHWSDTSHDYLEQMITAIWQLGFFDV